MVSNDKNMTKESSTTPSYKSLYNYLAVLGESQVYKLHKIVSGLLDISSFSTAEIEQLENRYHHITFDQHFLPLNKN